MRETAHVGPDCSWGRGGHDPDGAPQVLIRSARVHYADGLRLVYEVRAVPELAGPSTTPRQASHPQPNGPQQRVPSLPALPRALARGGVGCSRHTLPGPGFVTPTRPRDPGRERNREWAA